MATKSTNSSLIPERFGFVWGVSAAIAVAVVLYAISWLDALSALHGVADLWLLPIHVLATFAIITALGEYFSIRGRWRALEKVDWESPGGAGEWATSPFEECRRNIETRHDSADIKRRIDEYCDCNLKNLDDRWFCPYLIGIGLLLFGAILAIAKVFSIPRAVFPVLELLCPVFWATVLATLVVVVTLLASRMGKNLLRDWSEHAKQRVYGLNGSGGNGNGKRDEEFDRTGGKKEDRPKDDDIGGVEKDEESRSNIVVISIDDDSGRASGGSRGAERSDHRKREEDGFVPNEGDYS